MIAKKYRLKTREVKKVLQKGKPFFSYSIVFNVIPHTLGYNRYAIVISGKSVRTNVIRNRYRRLFYDLCSLSQERIYGDVVCVVKTKTKLQDTPESLQKMKSEITYLFEKKLGKNI